MQYTDNEAALIGGLISNYFFQPSVDAKLRESYRRVLRHLHENTLSASDLNRIQNALTFLSPLCRDTREKLWRCGGTETCFLHRIQK